MNPTVTFGIPMAPRERTRDWNKAMDNLNRTLNSLENQTSDNYNVVLVRTDDDEIRLDKEYRNLFILNNPDLEEFSLDKDNKTREAMYFHQDVEAKFFFRMDWDDLVHQGLVNFLQSNPENKNGWMINWGYFYKPDIDGVIPFQGYWSQCGSAFVINFSKEECLNGPPHEFHHQRMPKNREIVGKPLSVIPYYYGLYTIHENNLSHEKHLAIFKDAKWQTTPKTIKEDFGL